MDFLCSEGLDFSKAVSGYPLVSKSAHANTVELFIIKSSFFNKKINILHPTTPQLPQTFLTQVPFFV